MLKKLCLKPLTKIIFSIKGDEPILILAIPTILPFESSQKVTVTPSWYLDRLLNSYPKSCVLSNRYQDTTPPYILEPWCVPTSNNEVVDFWYPYFLGSYDTSTLNPNMIIRSIYTIKTKFS